MTLAIIDTSTANIASVRFALERLGAEHVLAPTPADAVGAHRLILPGVGAAGPAIARLDASGWARALRAETRPLLGVCLGMQLLFDYSQESECAGLGLIPGQVKRLDPGADGPWPHMGWNTLEPVREEPLMAGVPSGSHAYFVHGFHVPEGPHTTVRTRYGGPVTAIARRGHIAGCQFHPERSGSVGAQILRNFLETRP
ncbi:MAG: imidazole glycerol phosphate synthase subunit HisH [Oceanicaulis sp.]